MTKRKDVNPKVKSFFDVDTSTFTHIVYENEGTPCLIIDPVLNFDPKSGRTSTHSADEVIDFIKKNQLHVEFILETHAHADHLSSAHFLKKQFGGKVAIGEHILEVQKVFKEIFNLEQDFVADGKQFDYLIKDNEEFSFGKLSFKGLFVPGHTPACMAYQIGDAIFVGDTMFPPDVGSARCDFPGGNAKHLYQSVMKIMSFPESTRLFMCHDYPLPGRKEISMTTVKDQQLNNIHIHHGVTQDQFVEMRQARDATLDMPHLIIPAIQVNIRAGSLPPVEGNGVSYLKIPLNML